MGGSVAAYPQNGQLPGNYVPSGTATSSATVGAGGALTIAGLTEGGYYWAVGQDSQGRYRWTNINVPFDPVIEDPELYSHASDTTNVHGIADTADVNVVTESWLNPMYPEFGALFDGVTDDSAAIQACIDAGPTILPNGSASLGATGLTITRNDVMVRGTGREVCELKYTGTGAAIKNSNTALIRRRTTLSDFTLDIRGVGAGARGIEFQNLYHSDMSRLYVDGQFAANVQACVKFIATGGESSHYNHFWDCYFSSGGTNVVEFAGGNSNSFYGGLWDGAAVALALSGGGGNRFIGTNIEAQDGGVCVSLTGGAGDNEFISVKGEPSASTFTIASGCSRNVVLAGTWANTVTFVVGSAADENTIIVPTQAIFKYGRAGVGANRKSTVDLPSTSDSVGITIGGDTNLYRPSAGNLLKTDDALHVALELRHLGSTLGFYNATAVTKPTVTGSRGANAALASLLTQLASLGLITDSSS